MFPHVADGFCPTSIWTLIVYLLASLLYLIGGATFYGCTNNAAISANEQALDAQQAELNQLKQQIAAIQARPAHYSAAPLRPGSCDSEVMREATRKGGERFAANDLAEALNYYQDAVTACPGSAQAQLNIARTYEAIGDRSQALVHYRIAAHSSPSASDAQAVRGAREALSRLGG